MTAMQSIQALSGSLTPFSFEGVGVRVITIDGEPWFVAKDIAGVLGYANSRKAVADHCKAPRPAGCNDSLPPLDPQTTLIPSASAPTPRQTTTPKQGSGVHARDDNVYAVAHDSNSTRFWLLAN